MTDSPGEADFILAHGTEAMGQPGGAPAADRSLEEMRAVMQACAARGLPMIVANPDLVSQQLDEGLEPKQGLVLSGS